MTDNSQEDFMAHLPVALKLADEAVQSAMKLVIHLYQYEEHIEERSVDTLLSLCESIICTLKGAKEIASQKDFCVKEFIAAFVLPLPFIRLLFTPLDYKFWLESSFSDKDTAYKVLIGVVSSVCEIAHKLNNMHLELKDEVDWTSLEKESI